LTSMDEPLGHKIGNSLEIYEAIETLEGNGPHDLTEVVSVITGHLLRDAEVVKSYEEGYKLALETLQTGKALESFYTFVKAQGGDVDFLKNKANLIGDTKVEIVRATKDGFLEKIEDRKSTRLNSSHVKI